MALEISPNISIFRWHSIRPWTQRFSLSVRELTSVSATFILSSLSAHTNLSLILDGDDTHSDDEDEPSGGTSTEQPVATGSRSQRIISDALSKGLSVTVNGAPWQRVLIRVDDEADEAVIIIYGLMPGRQYDIELGVIPGEERVKRQITTESRRAFSPFHPGLRKKIHERSYSLQLRIQTVTAAQITQTAFPLPRLFQRLLRLDRPRPPHQRPEITHHSTQPNPPPNPPSRKQSKNTSPF